MAAADVDDTTRCPAATWCESCNRTEDLYVVTAGSGMGGVLCMTLCGECCDRPLPNLAVLEAAIRTGEHCEHLGIDLDEMTVLAESGRA